MIAQPHRARAVAALVAAGLAASALAGCERKHAADPGAQPADAAAPAIVDAGGPLLDASDATPKEAKEPEIPCLAEAMTALEPHATWLLRFEGSVPADKQSPPRLGALKELDKLPPSQLAFVRGGRLFAMDLPGGAPRPLTEGPKDRAPIWSPRGTHLAFIRAERAHLVRADGTEVQRLSKSDVRSELTFSGDGRYLAFFSSDDIVVCDLQTSTDRRIPVPSDARGVEDVGPVFERAGSRLAFAHNRQVFVADAATGKAERHEWGARNEVISLAFAGDALLVALNAAEDRPRQTVVKRLALDHKGKLDPELFPSPSVDASLTLFAAPRGTRVAFENVTAARLEKKQPDGSWLLTQGDWLRHDIAFYDGARPARDSTSVRGNFPEPRFSTESPAWAPDGRHLGYVMKLWEHFYDSAPLAAGIVVVDTDRPSKPAVIVACGDTPAWGPAKAESPRDQGPAKAESPRDQGPAKAESPRDQEPPAK
jgi:hypothetical protein